MTRNAASPIPKPLIYLLTMLDIVKDMVGFISDKVTARAEMRAESIRQKAYHDAVYV